MSQDTQRNGDIIQVYSILGGEGGEPHLKINGTGAQPNNQPVAQPLESTKSITETYKPNLSKLTYAAAVKTSADKLKIEKNLKKNSAIMIRP